MSNCLVPRLQQIADSVQGVADAAAVLGLDREPPVELTEADIAEIRRERFLNGGEE